MPHTFETQPIEVERHYSGMMTQRNLLAIPIRIMGRRIIELYDVFINPSNDAEISVRSTVQRRCGYLQYNSNPVNGIPQKFYAFQPSSLTNTIFPIVDTTTNVYTVPPSTGSPVSLITKSQATQSSFFGLGNYLYIGNQYFSQKWDGGSPQGITNWGITMTNPSSNVNSYVGTGADGGGPTPWSTPANFQGAPDGNLTSASVSAGSMSLGTSNNLLGTNYGFSIGALNTVSGIQVTLTGLQSAHFSTNFGTTPLLFVNVYLQYNGATIGTFKAAVLPLSNGTVVLGSPSDTWGATLNSTIINSSTFGVRVVGVVNNTSFSGTRSCT